MRKLKLQVQVSIDGYMAGPEGDMDWLEWNWDDELKQYVTELTNTVDCILLGRKLAQGFIDSWEIRAEDPNTADDFARKMRNTEKIVFTRSIYKAAWKNTRLEPRDIVEEVTRLKNQDGYDMIVYGGGTLVRTLIDADLIDELHLFVNPTALGSGMPVFGSNKNMRLIKSQPFECGIVMLCYEPVRF